MFLALKEMKHDKLRYGLIILMIALIAYLIFILTSLATGLASQNTQAINSWDSQRITLNKDSNINIGQSQIAENQLNHVHLDDNKDALIGNSPVVATQKHHERVSAQFIALNPAQYIYKDLKVTEGKKAQNKNQIVADSSLKQMGYKLGDKVSLNSSSVKFKITGFTKNAKLNIAPVLYGSFSAWRIGGNVSPIVKGNAIISKSGHFRADKNGLHSYLTNTVVQNLPGYSAQNSTFTFMIAFLLIISLIVIAVFLYILTMQKIQNYAVLRAQGIPASFLVISTLLQSLIMAFLGILIGGILTFITIMGMSKTVPISLDLPLLGITIVGMLLLSLVGAFIPALMIAKIDPADAIGG